MPVEAKSMETATPFDKLSLILVGAEKTGKSRTAATAPDPVLFLDTDQRAASISGMKGVYALTYSEPSGVGMQPTIYTDLVSFTDQIERSRELRTLHPTFGNLPQGLNVSTLVGDSVATISKAALAYALYTTKEIRRSIKLPGREIFMPGGWDAWSADMNMLETLVTRWLAIPNLNVILTFHETAEESNTSTPEKPSYTGRVDVWPGRHRRLIKYFNEVWRVTRTQQVPQIQIVPNWEFTASTNLLLSDGSGVVQNPNIKELIQKTLAARK